MQDKWLNRQGAQEQEGDAIGLRSFPPQRGTVQCLPPRHHVWSDTHCWRLQGDPRHRGARAADVGQLEKPPQLQHVGAQRQSFQPRLRAAQAEADIGHP